jgi:hypothetical protein
VPTVELRKVEASALFKDLPELRSKAKMHFAEQEVD